MLRSALVVVLSSLLLPWVAGCSQPPATQLIVVVDTDYEIPTGLDEIDVDVMGTDGMHHSVQQPMASAASLPYTLTVVPSGSSLGPIRIVATGLLAGRPQVSREARVTLVRNETRMVRLDLLRACDLAAMLCTGMPDQTCAEGGHCTSIDVAPEPWSGVPARIGDAGTPPSDGGSGDAGTDASMPRDVGPLPDAFATPDALAPTDAGTDAGAHDTGTCMTDPQCDDGNPCTDDHCSAGTCTHANNTSSCGTTMCGAYGTCDNPTSPCSTSGMQTRTCTDMICSAGACGLQMRTEMAMCTRPSQDGVTCMATTCGAWSACDYTGNCHPAAMQSRSCTDHVCGAGTCGTSMHSEMQACPQAPVNTICTDTTIQCGTYRCNASGTCAPAGGQCVSPQVCCNPPICSNPLTC